MLTNARVPSLPNAAGSMLQIKNSRLKRIFPTLDEKLYWSDKRSNVLPTKATARVGGKDRGKSASGKVTFDLPVRPERTALFDIKEAADAKKVADRMREMWHASSMGVK